MEEEGRKENSGQMHGGLDLTAGGEECFEDHQNLHTFLKKVNRQTETESGVKSASHTRAGRIAIRPANRVKASKILRSVVPPAELTRRRFSTPIKMRYYSYQALADHRSDAN